VVLAYQRYGSGKALAFTVQDSWQWQMSSAIPLEDLTHEGLWRQMLRWLVSDVPGPVQVTPSADRLSPGRSVELRVEVRDEAYVRAQRRPRRRGGDGSGRKRARASGGMERGARR
jgi:hypothetical protein